MVTMSYIGNKAMYQRECHTAADVAQLVIDICANEGWDNTKRQQVEMQALRAFAAEVKKLMPQPPKLIV